MASMQQFHHSLFLHLGAQEAALDELSQMAFGRALECKTFQQRHFEQLLLATLNHPIMTRNNFGNRIYFRIVWLQKYQFDLFYSDENPLVNDRYPIATAVYYVGLNFPISTA